MSFRAKRELLVQVAPRYPAARHGQRSAILDEFVAVTGYEREYAIRLFLGPIRPPEPIRRPRAAHYGVEVQQALATAWTAANGIRSSYDGRRSLFLETYLQPRTLDDSIKSRDPNELGPGCNFFVRQHPAAGCHSPVRQYVRQN